MKDYIATYKTNNGCIIRIYKDSSDGLLYDDNNIEITMEELKEYKKID